MQVSTVREHVSQTPVDLEISSSLSGFQALCLYAFSFSSVLENNPLEA